MAESGRPLDFRALVDEHYAALYRYAYRLCGAAADAEDLTQETFCTAQVKLSQLRDPVCARGWLCTILRHQYLKQLRTGAAIAIESLDGLADDIEGADESGPEGMDTERLERVLADLPEAFRAPLVLFYFEEFSYREIAEQLGLPMGTVMSRLARAKVYLRSKLRRPYCVSLPDPSPREQA